jgi:hypothetical protein
MKHFSIFAFLFSLLSLAMIGCSSGGDPIQTPKPDSVTYKTSTNYKYVEHPRDSTDQNTQITDTITSSVTGTDTTIDGKSHVTTIQNTHSLGSAADVTYIAQSNGEYWHYNFGLEGFETYLKGSLGWVLQAKLNAKEGDTWVAKEKTSVGLTVAPVNVDVEVKATEKADTTIKIASETVTNVKHVVQTVSIYAGTTTPVATSNIDTYVSAKYGMVATVRHSTKIDHPLFSGQVPGSERVMISHP